MSTAQAYSKMTDKTKLPPKHANDFFETPRELCDAAMKFLAPVIVQPMTILDAGAGNGVWGEAARQAFPDAFIVGVELDNNFPVNPAYNQWFYGDYLKFKPAHTFTHVIGNPPYSLAEEFIQHSKGLMTLAGRLVFLLRLEFLASQGRRKGLYAQFPLEHVAVCSRRPSFNGTGKTQPQDYALFKFRNSGVFNKPTLEFWDYKERDRIVEGQNG